MPLCCVVLCSVMEGGYASLSNWWQFVSFDFFFFLAAKEAIRFHFCFGYFVVEFPFCRRQALHILCCMCACVLVWCLLGGGFVISKKTHIINAQPRCCFFLFWIFPLSRLRFYGGAYELWPTGIFDFPSPLPRHSSSLVDESKISSTFGVSLFFAFAFCGCWFSLAAVWWRRRRRRRWIVTSYFWLFRMMLLPFFGSILLDSHSLQTTVKHARASPFQK
jgi:hypothetical protein